MSDLLDYVPRGEFSPGHAFHLTTNAHHLGGVRHWARCKCGWRVGGFKTNAEAIIQCWRHQVTVSRTAKKEASNG